MHFGTETTKGPLLIYKRVSGRKQRKTPELHLVQEKDCTIPETHCDAQNKCLGVRAGGRHGAVKRCFQICIFLLIKNIGKTTVSVRWLAPPVHLAGGGCLPERPLRERSHYVNGAPTNRGFRRVETPPATIHAVIEGWREKLLVAFGRNFDKKNVGKAVLSCSHRDLLPVRDFHLVGMDSGLPHMCFAFGLYGIPGSFAWNFGLAT